MVLSQNRPIDQWTVTEDSERTHAATVI
jgi:hypothetical protein